MHNTQNCFGAHPASYTRKYVLISSRDKLRVKAEQAPLSTAEH